MNIIKRKRYLDMLASRRDNGRAKIVTGIRRCGKPFLLSTPYKRFLLDEHAIDLQRALARYERGRRLLARCPRDYLSILEQLGCESTGAPSFAPKDVDPGGYEPRYAGTC